MGKYVRNNAWNKGGDFSSQDLHDNGSLCR
jgi:hypothetical protein